MLGFSVPHTLGQLLGDLISFLILMIIIEVVISYIIAYSGKLSSYHPFVKFVRSIVNPILNPLRRILPPPYKTGGWDFSPMIAIILLQIIRNWLY
jgi:YggT family protein